MIAPGEMLARLEHIATIENTIATGTSGDYTGEEAINAEFDVIRANRDYAILGYIVGTECLTIRYRGSDSGNLGFGGPGNATRPDLTANWFVDLAFRMQLPLIPVFNSSNKDSLLLDAVQDENGADVTVQTIIGLLAEKA